MSWRSKGDQVVPEEAPVPTDDDAVLVQRLAELTHREVALRRITEVVEKQRTRLEERERVLERAASAAAAAGEERLAEAIRRAEQSEQRARELEQHVNELEARPEPQPREVAIEAPTPDAEPPLRARAVDPDATEAAYTLQRLERLVREAELRGDPQAEEWAYYLPLLREQAEPDGRLPAQFAALVDSIFAA
jgi:hypothetical protein